MANLDIASVAQRSGLPASTLRHYEAKGLIASVGRYGLRRVFDGGVLERLSLIALGRAAGFALDEIAAMFPPGGGVRIDRAKLAARPSAIRDRRSSTPPSNTRRRPYRPTEAIRPFAS